MIEERIGWENWRDLESGAIAFGSLNARRLPTAGITLAVDHLGRRHVLLPVPDLGNRIRDARSRGLSVATRELEVEGRAASPFIDVCCTDTSNLDAFDVVATALVRDAAAGISAADAVLQTLARWRRFWGAVPAEGLTADAARGLFGELWFLLVWLLPHGTEMMDRWVGATGARHDFQWPGLAIEVKTTTSIRGHIHRINGLDQLDPPERGPLRLFSLRLREEPAATNSLVTVITGIREVIAADAARLDFFEDALAAVGYSSTHEERHAETRFRVVEERLVRVEDDFPRLSVRSLRDGVPRGIERIDYDVNLDGFPHLLLAVTPAEFQPPR
jgi:hypothetical protein